MHLTVAKGEAGGGLTNDREITPGIQHDFYTFLFLHTAHFAIAMLLPQASAAVAPHCHHRRHLSQSCTLAFHTNHDIIARLQLETDPSIP